jgi:hypothetical protein
MRRKFLLYIFVACLALGFASCSDEEYSVSKSDLLSLAVDTVRMDTVFSNVPSSTKTFWVYNNTGKNIRLSSVRLNRGNQSGFRVNVDGVYLGSETGFQTSQVEVASHDSIRVYVELTPVNTGANEPQKIEDDVVFTLESGSVQKVNLNAFVWDATIMNSPKIKEDTSWSGDKPIVVYGSLMVDSLATLTINAGTTVYFRDEASLDVYGRLLCKGEPGNEVVLRGYRLDHMFDYLPYDRVSGQWGGVHLHESSYNNELDYTDLHSASTGIEIDSCDTVKVTLIMNASTVHNCQGYGINANNCNVKLNNCQITNTLYDCFFINGGTATLNNCTLAQFYPYDSQRGMALNCTDGYGDLNLLCTNTLVTGYADDVLLITKSDSTRNTGFKFEDCILRTPKVTTEDSVRFVNVQFENPEDTATAGKKHFMNIDTDNLIYDFRLDSISPAVDKGNPLTATPTDRYGLRRDDKPDIGAFERTN